jgi:hypothetical protein
LQDTGIKLIPKIAKATDTIGFSYSSLNGLNHFNYLPDIRTEDDVKKCTEMMTDFLVNTALPIVDKFNDLREIDKLINGIDPWTTDWQMPYAFGGNFYEKRLIIAKLAGNSSFDDLVDFNYKTLEKLSAENGHPFTYNRSDLAKPLPALIKILQDVKPLYVPGTTAVV